MPESAIAAVAEYFGTSSVAATAAATATEAVAGNALASTALNVVGSAVASNVIGGLLKPDKPDLPPVTAMPDPLAQEQARKEALIEQMARRGRASTILTAPASGDSKLGG